MKGEKGPAPEDVRFLYEKGMEYFQAENYEQALVNFKKLLEIIPRHPYSLYFTGLIHGLGGEVELAIDFLGRAIAIKGDEPEFYDRLGLLLYNEGKAEKAAGLFKKALELEPRAVYYHNLGRSLLKMNLPEAAAENFREAIRLEPENYICLNNLGVALYDLNETEEACRFFEKAISLNSVNPEYYNNLGLALSRFNFGKISGLAGHGFYNDPRNALKNKQDQAAANFLKAVSINLENPEYYNNLGIALQRSGKVTDAGDNFLKAISLDATNPQYYHNLATNLEETGEYCEAIKYYKKTIELAPAKKMVYHNLSLVYLRLQEFEKGWENIEVFRTRYARNEKLRDLYRKPQWNGENIAGKTIYACAEQGLGDTLHYMRYLPFLKEMGAKVIFHCQPEMLNLLKNSEGFDLIVSNPVSEGKQHFDFFVLLMSLCRIFTPSVEKIPATVPYVFPDPDLTKEWSAKFNLDNRKKIGFTWLSGFSNSTFYKRSCPVEFFYNLARENPDIMFYSLQKAPFGAGLQNYRLANIVDFSEEIADFSDTAAIIENLDILISVDTSVAHLAGAMGRKVFNLLPYSADWRWFLEKDDSPWYPSMRLVRQISPGNWESVFEKVREILRVV
jgi:Flp pilus assembly protein TadD